MLINVNVNVNTNYATYQMFFSINSPSARLTTQTMQRVARYNNTDNNMCKLFKSTQ